MSINYLLPLIRQAHILAQGYQDLGSHFSGGSGYGVHGLLLFFAVAVTVVVVTWLAARYTNPPGPYRSPGRLFRELCVAHKLNGKDRRLLRRLAKRHYVPPHQVFVQPDFFELPGGEGGDSLQDEVSSLRKRLFA